jgi:hypothetical protein
MAKQPGPNARRLGSTRDETSRRAREVVRPTGGIVRGKFPSRKNGCMVHHEGLLELDALYLFEWSAHILRYREQPLTMTYPDGNRLRRYTPDFALTLIDGSKVLLEIKPISNLNKPNIHHKFLCIADHLRRSEQAFEVITDQVIREQPRLANLKLIHHGAKRFPVSHDALRIGLQRFARHFPMCCMKFNRT